MLWLAVDQDKTNYSKRTGILLLFGLLKVPYVSYARDIIRKSSCGRLGSRIA